MTCLESSRAGNLDFGRISVAHTFRWPIVGSEKFQSVVGLIVYECFDRTGRISI